MLLLHGAQLVLRSSVLTVLNLNEVNFTLENTEIFGSVLSGELPRWICWWRLAVLLKCSHSPQLPPATPKNSPPFIASLLLFCFRGDGGNQYSIRTLTLQINRKTTAGSKDHSQLLKKGTTFGTK